ncbi:metalloregulator ArsR/SmtB family transcription factor [Nocardiopsis sp. N85]|uniref:ArsR/SmtB family transcription factor n=1 Tax=Nocardiopsis sp. N85 TaxID=3029400 RepID=UPI00237FD54D|nr:metalloregulator ArsR/SmtB family transcription factor [Nocardiopsis sp. N85]MDE3722608.1 metalloregulator ArsR/SmtB family transcription factor [Nocardiopsis sp. N85]
MLISVDADLMKVLADPLRMRIVTLLADETLCTTHLMEETGAKQTNLSNHLRVLREAGVVETEPCGRFTYYRLRPEALEDLAGALGDLAATARAAGAVNRRAC